MKTIIKIAIAIVVVLGCVNVGRALMNEYRFEDQVHEALLFDPHMTDAEIVQEVMKAAAEYDIPIEPGDIHVRDVSGDVRVEMSYTTTVVVIPGVFEKEWTFTPSTSTRVLVGNRRKPG
jgi:hypothetical protein